MDRGLPPLAALSGQHDDNIQYAAASGLDRRPQTPPPLARTRPNGPRTRIEPEQARQDRQPRPATVEAATRAVHRAALSQEIRPTTTRGRRTARAAGTTASAEEDPPEGRADTRRGRRPRPGSHVRTQRESLCAVRRPVTRRRGEFEARRRRRAHYDRRRTRGSRRAAAPAARIYGPRIGSQEVAGDPAASTREATICDFPRWPNRRDRNTARPHLPISAGGAGALPAAERRLTPVRGALCSGTTDCRPYLGRLRARSADDCMNRRCGNRSMTPGTGHGTRGPAKRRDAGHRSTETSAVGAGSSRSTDAVALAGAGWEPSDAAGEDADPPGGA